MTTKMMIIEVIDSTKSTFYRHITHIANHLRSADNDELSAASELDPADEVIRCYKNSNRTWVIIKKDNSVNIPVAVFGVTGVENNNFGAPWMVATDDFKSIKNFVLKNVKKYIKEMLDMFEGLIGFVDERNTESIKFLKYCGFSFGDSINIGNDNIPFKKFFLRRS